MRVVRCARVEDTSAADFAIKGAVTVTSPNGGETWGMGTLHAITWTASDNVAVTAVSLDYSTNNGGSWSSIATGLANSGSYNWTRSAANYNQENVVVTPDMPPYMSCAIAVVDRTGIKTVNGAPIGEVHVAWHTVVHKDSLVGSRGRAIPYRSLVMCSPAGPVRGRMVTRT